MDLMDCRKDSAMSRHVDQENCLDTNSCISSTRPTFYDLPRDQVPLAVLPDGMLGAASTTSMLPLPSSPHHIHLELDLEPDEYGWVALENDLFYNTRTCITADRHPFDEEA